MELPEPARQVRLAELVAALSLATDLAVGQPMEWSIRSCMLAVQVAERLRLSVTEQRDVYYVTLLRFIGCTGDAHQLAQLTDDEMRVRRDAATLDLADPGALANLFARPSPRGLASAKPGRPASTVVEQVLAAAPEIFRGQCDVASDLAGALGCGNSVQEALAQIHKSWDGGGFPLGLSGDGIHVSTRIANVALDAELFERIGGIGAATSMLRARSGAMYDPLVCDVLLRLLSKGNLLGSCDVSWAGVLEAEPGLPSTLTAVQLDRALEAVAEFADLKSPFTLGHSKGVSELAERAAAWLGWTDEEAATARRAGWLHDIGRVAVSANRWERSGALSEADWVHVRLHPFYTSEVFPAHREA